MAEPRAKKPARAKVKGAKKPAKGRAPRPTPPPGKAGKGTAAAKLPLAKTTAKPPLAKTASKPPLARTTPRPLEPTLEAPETPAQRPEPPEEPAP